MMNMLAENLAVEAANEALDRERRLTHEMLRPFMLLRPPVSLDGNKWCVLYGDNLQVGVAGFGDSPDEASREFDKAWYEQARPKGA